MISLGVLKSISFSFLRPYSKFERVSMVYVLVRSLKAAKPPNNVS